MRILAQRISVTLREATKGRGLSVLALGFVWAWLYFMGGSLLFDVQVTSVRSFELVHVWKATTTISLLILGHAFDSKSLAASRVLVGLGMLTGLLATAVLLLSSPRAQGLSALVAGEILVGVSYAITLRGWADGDRSPDRNQIVVGVSLSWMVAGILYLFLTHLQPILQSIMLMVLPLSAGLCLLLVHRTLSPTKTEETTRPSNTGDLLVCVVLCSLASGVFSQATSFASQPVSWAYGSLLIAVPMLAWASRAIEEVNSGRLLALASLVISGGIVTGIIFPASNALSMGFASAGFFSLFLLVLVTSSWVGTHERRIRGRVVSRWLSLFIGLSTASGLLTHVLDIDHSARLTIAALLLALGSISVLGRRTLFETQKDDPAQQVLQTQDLEQRCDDLAFAHGLTRRECQVLSLLAKGYTVKAIAAEYTVSQNTVKSQTRSVYVKLGVHTRQELLSLIRVHASHPCSHPASHAVDTTVMTRVP